MNAEALANDAIKNAIQALQRALELSEQAGYGSLVIGPLANAQQEARYAHNTATGRT